MYAKIEISENGNYTNKSTGEKYSLIVGNAIHTPNGEITPENLQDWSIVDSEEAAITLFNLVLSKDYKPTVLVKIIYSKLKQVFTVLNSENNIKLVSGEDCNNYTDLIASFKDLCTELKNDWKEIQWYEPNILNLDGQEFKIIDMSDIYKYTIWQIGEMCKNVE